MKYFLKDEKGLCYELPEQLEDIISDIDDDKLEDYAKREFAPLELTACVDLTLPAIELFVVLCGCCTIAQVTSNNWRRLHGIPMMRRRYLIEKESRQ